MHGPSRGRAAGRFLLDRLRPAPRTGAPRWPASSAWSLPHHPSAALRAALALLAAGCATSGTQNVAVRSPHPGSRFWDTQVACDGTGNVYAVGIEETPADSRIFFAASNRNGESWNPELRCLNSSTAGQRRWPQLATGAAGEVYVVWQDTRQGPRDLYFDCSTDGGTTWLPSNVRVNTNAPAGSHVASVALACDTRGNVYVVWLDNREGFDAFYVNRSRDRGRTWLQNDVRATSLTLGRKSPPHVTCDDQGNLYAVWVEERNASQSVYFNASQDYGETWNVADQPLGSTAARAYWPEVRALGSNVLFVAWLEDSGRSAEVVYRRSANRGQWWDDEPGRFPVTSQRLYDPSAPQLASDGQGHVYLAWHARTLDGASRLVLRASGDAGRSFTETIVTRPYAMGGTDLAGATPALVPPFSMASDRTGNVYFAWTEVRAGTIGVGFDRVSNYGRTWVPLANAPDVGPHPPETVEPPALCADDFGHVVLLWNEGWALHAAASPFYGDAGWHYEDF